MCRFIHMLQKKAWCFLSRFVPRPCLPGIEHDCRINTCFENCASAEVNNNFLPPLKHRVLGATASVCIFRCKGFQPYAPTYCNLSLDLCFRQHEGEKRWAYEQCIREVEKGSFTPLVFTTSGGMGKAAKITYKRLASLLSVKREQLYSLVMGWLWCCLFFSLLRSAVMCIRGSRSHKGYVPFSDTHLELVAQEGRVLRS